MTAYRQNPEILALVDDYLRRYDEWLAFENSQGTWDEYPDDMSEELVGDAGQRARDAVEELATATAALLCERCLKLPEDHPEGFCLFTPVKFVQSAKRFEADAEPLRALLAEVIHSRYLVAHPKATEEDLEQLYPGFVDDN